MGEIKTPVTIMRAGTSKGIFINANDLPKDDDIRDERIRRIFGSPDIRQIDGLGGADPLTSKLAIIKKSNKKDVDVEYTFGQVSYITEKIDYSGNCGNISTGVGPYSVNEGLVDIEEPYTTVRILNTNTGKMLIEKVEVENGRAKVLGDYSIAGVPGTGSPVEIDFSDTAGSSTGKLLPTGNVKDVINVEGFGDIEVSIVDAANPMVFLRAESLNLTGIEKPSEIDENKDLLKTLEEIRGKSAVMMGLIDNWKDAEENIPAFPMLAFVTSSKDYEDFTTGNTISEDEIDFVSRLMFMQVIHKTYAGTGTICTGAAAKIKGTIVEEAIREKNKGKDKLLKIGHPAGVITIEADVSKDNEEYKLNKAIIKRTARRIMEGNCYTTK